MSSDSYLCQPTTALELLEELDNRHDQVIGDLDNLANRIEEILNFYKPPAPVSPPAPPPTELAETKSSRIHNPKNPFAKSNSSKIHSAETDAKVINQLQEIGSTDNGAASIDATPTARVAPTTLVSADETAPVNESVGAIKSPDGSATPSPTLESDEVSSVSIQTELQPTEVQLKRKRTRKPKTKSDSATDAITLYQPSE